MTVELMFRADAGGNFIACWAPERPDQIIAGTTMSDPESYLYLSQECLDYLAERYDMAGYSATPPFELPRDYWVCLLPLLSIESAPSDTSFYAVIPVEDTFALIWKNGSRLLLYGGYNAQECAVYEVDRYGKGLNTERSIYTAELSRILSNIPALAGYTLENSFEDNALVAFTAS